MAQISLYHKSTRAKTKMNPASSVPEAASRFLKFVNASPTPFHAVHNAAAHLERAGFRKVQSSIVATNSGSHRLP